MDEINETLLGICENYLKIKNIDKCKSILETIEENLHDDDIDTLIKCKLIRYTIENINENDEEAENILVSTYEMAKDNSRLSKAAELAMKIGKYFIDRKEDKRASFYLGEGIRLFEEYEKSKN